MEELLQEKNTPMLFAPRKDNGTSKPDAAASGNRNGDKRQLPFVTTEFPTSSTTRQQTFEKVRMEALTSPFDFLFR
jgi:hypothetical protein